MSTQSEDRRALFLMLSLLLYFIAGPFLSANLVGEILTGFILSWIMVAAILELAANTDFVRAAIPVAIACLALSLLFYFYSSRTITMLYFGMLVLFLGLVATGLFAYLGRQGAVTSGRLTAP